MQRKSLLAAFLFLGGLIAVSGCGDTAGTVAPQPTFGRVRVACPESLGKDIVKRFARNWERQTKGTVEIVPYDPRQDDRPDNVDALIIPAAELPHWAAADKLLPVPDSVSASEDYRWRSVLPLYGKQVISWDHKRYGLPILGEALVCVYREDWLKAPEHQKAFEAKYKHKLEAPATWEQFAEIAEYFAQANKAPSLPPLPADDDELEREFYTIAANYAARALSGSDVGDATEEIFSFQYDSGSGEPRIGTGGFVHALRLMKRMEACRPPDASRKPAEAFAGGQTVLCLAEPAQVAAFQQTPALKDKLGVCPLPAGGGYYQFKKPTEWVPREDNNRIAYVGGGWVGVVPKTTADEKAAFHLLTYLGSPEVSKQIVIDAEVGGRPFRKEPLSEAVYWAAFGLDPVRTSDLMDATRQMLEHRGLKNPALRLRIPDEAPHRKALEKELRAALAGDKTPEQALQDAAARWTKLDEAKGLKLHTAQYRISLGLGAGK
jgi:ABC-type glycerol-3-phosphate transport system substrate-binding protein